MNQQDRAKLRRICKTFAVLPDKKRDYLTGIVDGMAIMGCTADDWLSLVPGAAKAQSWEKDA